MKARSDKKIDHLLTKVIEKSIISKNELITLFFAKFQEKVPKWEIIMKARNDKKIDHLLTKV
eukprot:Pgem_evm1s9115